MFGERHLELPTTLLQHLYPNQGGWEELSFGLFGGIDIGCTCNVLRKHPIRLYIHTDRASIQQFCTLLQLPYFEQEIHSMQDVRSSIVMAMNTYPKTLLLVDGDVFLCLDSKARTLVALHTPEISIPIETILHRRTKIRMIALGEAYFSTTCVLGRPSGEFSPLVNFWSFLSFSIRSSIIFFDSVAAIFFFVSALARSLLAFLIDSISCSIR